FTVTDLFKIVKPAHHRRCSNPGDFRTSARLCRSASASLYNRSRRASTSTFKVSYCIGLSSPPCVGSPPRVGAEAQRQDVECHKGEQDGRADQQVMHAVTV